MGNERTGCLSGCLTYGFFLVAWGVWMGGVIWLFRLISPDEWGMYLAWVAAALAWTGVFVGLAYGAMTVIDKVGGWEDRRRARRWRKRF